MPNFDGKHKPELGRPHNEWDAIGWKKGLFYGIGIPWAIVVCTLSFVILVGLPAFFIWLVFF